MSTTPDALFEQHRAQVYAWAYRLLQNDHDALDVTQDVLIKWWKAHAKAEAPANAVGWLRRVTINLAIDTVRSAARRAPGRTDAPDRPPATPDAAQREMARCIAEALDTLTDRQRAVVVAKVYDGHTFARIAEEMNLSVPTVKTHYLRALQALRHKLPRSGDSHEL